MPVPTPPQCWIVVPIISSSGRTRADLECLAARLSLPIDMFTLDTGLLFPETYELWRQLQDRYGLTIRGVRPEHTVDEQAVHEGPELWSRDPDRCCEQRHCR